MTEYRNQGDIEIIGDFGQKCRVVKRDLLADMMAITNRKVKSYEEYKDLLDYGEDEPISDDSEITELLGEAGCPICEKDGKFLLGKCSEPNVGASCNIDYNSCEKMGAKRIGSFHTHPLGGTTPSIPDITCAISQEEDVMCIGGLKGKDRGVTCYTPSHRTRKFGLIYDVFRGFYYPKFEDPDGKISFYREEPPPTAEYLLAEEAYKYWSDDPDEQAEFKKQLEEDEIPQEFWDNYETEGEQDTLDVWRPETLAIVEKKRKEFAQTRGDLYVSELDP